MLAGVKARCSTVLLSSNDEYADYGQKFTYRSLGEAISGIISMATIRSNLNHIRV